MNNDIINSKAVCTLSKQDKVIALFKFLEELGKLKQKVILNIKDYNWWRSISSFPQDDENIKVYYRDRVIDDDSDKTDILLSVHKPNFQSCPLPDVSFEEWLESGWNDYKRKVKIKDVVLRPLDYIDISEEEKEKYKHRIDEENKTYKEFFTDERERLNAYESWLEKRNAWVDKQVLLSKTRDFFSELYRISVDIERESETLELIVADGFILDRENRDILHPILTKRVNIYHDAINNVIYLKDTYIESDIYSDMFQYMKDIHLSSINQLHEELRDNDYHPLDRNDLPVFFKKIIHNISSESFYSENGIPDEWQNNNRILLYRNPCYILRKRMDGAIKAIAKINEYVSRTNDIPAPIGDIVDGGKVEISEETRVETLEDQLAAVGGESIDILLSKEANREQLEIAKRIERHNAVLVQGPPGTGKTHTIANLMGYFLAQGKSILVTSHTRKALSVLKDKLAPEIQSLCVSLIDDSNVDMEKSIDGITNYMSRHNSFELEKEKDCLTIERNKIIKDLANIRRKIFSIINKECNCIVYNGEEISPSKAANYVYNNRDSLSYIPGNVNLYAPLPLTLNELTELYKSNGEIDVQDEKELKCDIPNPNELMSPYNFEENCNNLKIAYNNIKTISEDNGLEIEIISIENKIVISGKFGEFTVAYPDIENVRKLREYVDGLPKMEEWMQYCAIDGKRGGMYAQRWNKLAEQIQETCICSEAVVAQEFGKKVELLDESPEYAIAVRELENKYKQNNGKLRFFERIINSKLKIALNGAKIDGNQPQTVEDCKLILQKLKLKELRLKTEIYWNQLFSEYNVLQFNNLDIDNQEQVAAKYIPIIKRYQSWFDNEYKNIVNLMGNIGLPYKIIFQYNPLDNEFTSIKKILSALVHEIPAICEIFDLIDSINNINQNLNNNRLIIQKGKRIDSDICNQLIKAIDGFNVQDYEKIYTEITEIHAKRKLQYNREKYLGLLETVAPEWAEAIRKREGIHGASELPDSIFDAWKWKQYYGIIKDLISEPFSELQKMSLGLSKEYRKITAKFAEKLSWYHLLRRTENDKTMQQALIGWKQTVKRIGKGTGKHVAQYRAEARKLMVKCQNAVPGWIMPINKALESLTPGVNKFDVIIIDEASQADISALAILFMGKKLIIVGDDRQVSPMAVGIQIDKISALQEMYIINKIPNAHLYDAKMSIYDIAATTFKPLMLKEHFRCVPEIIGFSNWLSYDFKIKPLRDCSNSVLLPAVVNYRVENGQRIGKTNPNEAKAIVALMKACMEQPEYVDKSFGVISLLGDEQVKVIQEEIYKCINSADISKHRILCGNASNFQGDERDVIFLSVVECSNGNGPVARQGFGADDAYRKRYNVAVSRARDQLWVVDSLDSANDLKSGDIRKMLIDYSLNPDSSVVKNSQIENQSESPFELSVAKYLTLRGYNLVQQWKVGAYRLDMVVVCGQKKVAIECDGERWHSGEDKIREDMERQTILERLGWNFIRIRGSEYYSNPDKTMERILNELDSKGIQPEELSIVHNNADRETELLNRVKTKAFEILSCSSNTDNTGDIFSASVAQDYEKDGFDNPTKLKEKNISEKLAVVVENSINEKQLKTISDEIAVLTGVTHEVESNTIVVNDTTIPKKQNEKLASNNGINKRKKPLVGNLLFNSDENKIIEEAEAISAETWFSLSHWAKENNEFQPWKRSLLFSMGKLIKDGRKPSIKQAVHAISAYKIAIEKGFDDKK